MSILEFIDSMTGRLAWPLAALVLGVLFRRPLTGLLTRVRTLRWGGAEAELREATQEMAEAVSDAARPLAADGHEDKQVSRDRIERLMRNAAAWGYRIGQVRPSLPDIRIEWKDDQPRLLIDDEMQISVDRFVGHRGGYGGA